MLALQNYILYCNCLDDVERPEISCFAKLLNVLEFSHCENRWSSCCCRLSAILDLPVFRSVVTVSCRISAERQKQSQKWDFATHSEPRMIHVTKGGTVGTKQ